MRRSSSLAAACEAARATQGLMTPTALRAAGLGSTGVMRAVRAGDLHVVRTGVYAVEPLPALPRHVVDEHGASPVYVAHVRAALLALGDTATACGRTAAALYGWGMLVEPSRSIDVAVSHGRGRVSGKGLRVSQRRRLPRQRLQVLPDLEPLWIAAPAATVLDCCRSLPLVEAVVICDSALRAGAVRLPELRRDARRLHGLKEASRVRQVLRLADPKSGSVLESVLRYRLVEAGIAGFTTQHVVRDARGGRVLRVDFLFEAAALVVEADGARWHADPVRDRQLDNALAICGLRVLRYSWSEVVHDYRRVLEEIRAAIHSGTGDIQSATPLARQVA